MAHTFDPEMADRLEDPSRYRYCSREELLALLDPDPGDLIADVGSGTGFYTRDVAPHAGSVLGIDLQPAMHDLFRERGLPGNVSLLSADAGCLPIPEASLDGAFATMTFHEIATDRALAELERVLVPGGPIVAVDWSAAGEGEAGPPVSDRQSADGAASMLETAGFTVERSRERLETFVLVATR
ncbi:MAG: class I SAM-dependent methyltransferase [Halobacteriales archaeon]